MFCADANATPASSAAVLIRSLLLIGPVLSDAFPARRAIRHTGNKRGTAQFPHHAYLARRDAIRLTDIHPARNHRESLHERDRDVASMREFRGNGIAPAEFFLDTITTGRHA